MIARKLLIREVVGRHFEKSVFGAGMGYYAMKRSEPQSSGAANLHNRKHACRHVRTREMLV